MTKLLNLYELNPSVGDIVYCYNKAPRGQRLKVTHNWRVWTGAGYRWWSKNPLNIQQINSTELDKSKADIVDKTPTDGKWSEWKVNTGSPPEGINEKDVLVDYIMACETVEKRRRGISRCESASILRWQLDNLSSDIVLYRVQLEPESETVKFWFDGETFSDDRRFQDSWRLHITFKNGEPVPNSAKLVKE